MSDTIAPDAARNGDQGGEAVAPMVVNHQYVKDLSFEVPGAPEIFTTLRSQPHVQLNLDVQARRLHETDPVFEVGLVVRAEATDLAPPAEKPRVVFIVELTYAGIFTLSGVPPEQVEPVLLIEGPRLLFPFARAMVADITRDGGFPPVMLQPIDFVSLWQSRRGNAALN